MLAEDIAAADEELDEVYDDEEEGTIGALYFSRRADAERHG